jgi:hypothetical protein
LILTNNLKMEFLVHDVKMIEKTLSNIDVNNDSKYYYLIGDKAYKNKYNLRLNNKNVIMIAPNKKIV